MNMHKNLEKVCQIGKCQMGKISKGNVIWECQMWISHGRDFVDNIYHGKGKLFKKNVHIYEGDFVNGKYQGKGKFSLKEGKYYIRKLKKPNEWKRPNP